MKALRQALPLPYLYSTARTLYVYSLLHSAWGALLAVIRAGLLFGVVVLAVAYVSG